MHANPFMDSYIPNRYMLINTLIPYLPHTHSQTPSSTHTHHHSDSKHSRGWRRCQGGREWKEELFNKMASIDRPDTPSRACLKIQKKKNKKKKPVRAKCDIILPPHWNEGSLGLLIGEIKTSSLPWQPSRQMAGGFIWLQNVWEVVKEKWTVSLESFYSASLFAACWPAALVNDYTPVTTVFLSVTWPFCPPPWLTFLARAPGPLELS